MTKKKYTKYETLVYFTGVTAALLAFLVLEVLSVPLDFWGLLIISIGFIVVDILYFIACRREKKEKELE